MRADIGDLVARQYRDEADNVSRWMQIDFTPCGLFECDKLARLFATQPAPTQVLANRDAAFFRRACGRSACLRG